MLCFVPVLHGCVCYYVQNKRFVSSVLAITERRDMGLCDLPLPVFVGFWCGDYVDYVSQLPYVRYYVVMSSFKHAREE